MSDVKVRCPAQGGTGSTSRECWAYWGRELNLEEINKLIEWLEARKKQLEAKQCTPLKAENERLRHELDTH